MIQVIQLWKVQAALASANTWSGSSWASTMKSTTLHYRDR